VVETEITINWGVLVVIYGVVTFLGIFFVICSPISDKVFFWVTNPQPITTREKIILRAILFCATMAAVGGLVLLAVASGNKLAVGLVFSSP